KGNFRCDVNISVNKIDSDQLGTRCEIKNLNSIKSIAKAIEYESRRQVELIESGKKVIMQTRLFDPSTETTKKMRNKEEEDDYRYFPDPDLMPIILNDEHLEEIKATLPELPQKKCARYQKDYNLSNYDASVLISEKPIDDFFNAGVTHSKDTKNFVNLLLSELLGRLNKIETPLQECKISGLQLAELSNCICDGVISGKIAKDVMDIMLQNGTSAIQIIEEKGFKQLSDDNTIRKFIINILNTNPQQVEQYKQGKEKILGFFVGQIMKETKGQANPEVVNKVLFEEIQKYIN
ncbi:MAG: aspartyl-tRNA(Asn)/glutamyl-tRNA(Gln) amidotransferase subunit B, partial [Candidatus Deianiraeaceae bacterium]